MSKHTTYVLLRFSHFGQENFIKIAEDDTAMKSYLFDEARLNYRLQLFEIFTLPCLKAQSDPNFKLVILTSPELPDFARIRLAEACEGLDWLMFDKAPNYHVNAFQEILNDIRPDEDTHEITIRLDDDDAIGVDWVREVNAQAEALCGLADRFTAAAIFPQNGAILNFNHPHKPLIEARAKQPCSAGIALCVKAGFEQNVFGYAHQKVGRFVPMLSIPTEMSFLRTLHTTNISHEQGAKQYQQFEQIEAEDMGVLRARVAQGFAIDLKRADELVHYKDPLITPKRA